MSYFALLTLLAGLIAISMIIIMMVGKNREMIKEISEA